MTGGKEETKASLTPPPCLVSIFCISVFHRKEKRIDMNFYVNVSVKKAIRSE